MPTQNNLTIRTKDFIFKLEQVDDRIFHIQRAKTEKALKVPSLIIEPEIKAKKLTTAESAGNITVSTPCMKAIVNAKTSAVTFKNNKGRKLLVEKTCSLAKVDEGVEIKQSFEFESSEGLFGLGQYQDEVMNFQDHKVLVVQSNRTIAVPFLTSTKGFGILWDNNSWTEFSTKTDKKKSDGLFYSEIADAIDYYFVYGESFDGSIGLYRKLTGEAPMYGKWAYGFWQSKERYNSYDELENVIKGYRERGIPFDNIVQDWQYWDKLGWSALDIDQKKYPEPERRMKEFHEKYHAHIMYSVWPSISNECKAGQELKKNKLFYPIKCWNNGYVYDCYAPKARDIYWKHLKKGVFDRGADAFWLDGSEPEFFAAHAPEEFKRQMIEAGKCCLGSLKKYLNPYATFAVKAIYEGQRKATDKQRVYILTRSGFSGLQKYAASSWSGDIGGTWDVLKKQISAGINFCMAGIPYWTHDIGGFFTTRYKDGCLDPEYRELYLRWFQFGVFTPIFRSHGTNTPREMWRFGDKGELIYDALVKATKIRYKLMPYIYSCAGMVTHKAYTMMRGLPMDFPDDPKCYNVNDQYMFGPAIMACPVTERMYFASSMEDGEVVESSYFADENGKSGALTGYYFEGSDFKQFVKKKTDANINFDWSGGSPDGVSYYNYSITWKGTIQSDTSGEHDVTLVGCAAKLTFDGKCLVDKLDDEGKSINSYKLKLKLVKGKKYDIQIDYLRVPAYAQICLKWKQPGKEIKKTPDNEKMRKVYLPTGTFWYNHETNKVFKGGQTIKADAPIDVIPLFIRAGSIIPIGPEIMYAMEKPADPVTLRIYTGADGAFTLYEDEGDNYNYEKGAFAEIPVSWNDKKKELTIGKRSGSFPGMLKKRTFRPVIISSGKEIKKADIAYSGPEIRIKY